jgi:hypothetical protein
MDDLRDARQLDQDEILAVLEHDVFGEPGELRDTLTDTNNNYSCGQKV